MARGNKTMIVNTLVGLTITDRQKRLACLVQFSGRDLGRPFFLEAQTSVIGRDVRAQIMIDEVGVSRKHCQIVVASDGIIIEDLGSANGTRVNNRKLRSAMMLRDGDSITLGKATFKYFAPGNVEQLFFDKVYREKTIDEKTKVFNDKYMMSTLIQEMKIARSYKHELTFILYDLDHFKKVNDTFGHDFGDHVLSTTAEIVSRIVRKNDVLCRYGGEEFGIILRQTNLETAVKLAERIRKGVERFVFFPRIGSKRFRHVQTFSLGVARMHSRMKQPKELIKAADLLLYRAKKQGRNRVVFC